MTEQTISDGLGTEAPAICPDCGGKMQVCRPGDIRCSVCYDGNPSGGDIREKIGDILDFETDLCLDPTAVGKDDCGYETDSPACRDCQLNQLQALLNAKVKEASKQERERAIKILRGFHEGDEESGDAFCPEWRINYTGWKVILAEFEQALEGGGEGGEG